MAVKPKVAFAAGLHTAQKILLEGGSDAAIYGGEKTTIVLIAHRAAGNIREIWASSQLPGVYCYAGHQTGFPFILVKEGPKTLRDRLTVLQSIELEEIV